MFTAECILAAALLSAPQNSTTAEPELLGAPSRLPASMAIEEVLRPNILALAMAAEILDAREKGFVMGQDPLGDLEMLRGRWTDFAAAPTLDEAERFPDRKFLNEALALNRARRTQLTERLSIDLIHAEEIRAGIQSIDTRYQIWDAVRDSRCDYYYVTVRRQSLALLRELIGDEAFYSGRLPPPVP